MYNTLSIKTHCRIWRKIGHAWRTDLTPNGIQTLRGKYAQHLLAFENELSTGAPEREVLRKPKAPKTDAKVPGEAKAAKPKKVSQRGTWADALTGILLNDTMGKGMTILA